MSTLSALHILEQRLQARREQDLWQQLTALGPRSATQVSCPGHDLLVMASNDYLWLATHPRLAQTSLEQGTGSGASRLVTGTLAEHGDL